MLSPGRWPSAEEVASLQSAVTSQSSHTRVWSLDRGMTPLGRRVDWTERNGVRIWHLDRNQVPSPLDASSTPS